MSKSMTNTESLEIIQNMIQTTRTEFTGNQFYFIFWGWVLVVTNLAHHYLMVHTNYPQPYIVWLITIPALIFTIFRSIREKRNQPVKGLFDHIIGYLWMCFGICAFIVIFAGSYINWNINPIMLMLTGIPTFMTGIIVRYIGFVIGGIVFWVASVIGFLVEPVNHQLVGAIAITCGYLIPSYATRTKKL